MKNLSFLPGQGLELQSRGVIQPYPDLIGLWDEWAQEGPAVFLESAGPLGEASQWLILAGAPESEFYEDRGQGWLRGVGQLAPTPFEFLDFVNQVAPALPQFSPMPYCLSSAWFGAMGYDFGGRFQRRTGSPVTFDSSKHSSEGPTPSPEFYFFKPSRLVAIHRETKETFCFGREVFSISPEGNRKKEAFKVESLKARLSRAQYETMVGRALQYIAQGDIYQANLSQAFEASWSGSPAALYRTLRGINPGPFMGLMRGPGFTLVSSSPERLAAGKGTWLETRPIAGTRPRGKDPLEDLQMKEDLKTNAKEQAEHVMLVDLARNDLGRVSGYGTVGVRRFADIESYAKVHHLVSTVESMRREEANLGDILQSLFPGGTITGCPKVRCMEIIRELEGSPRGFYTGSLGYLAPGPCFDLNILIRSFSLFHDGRLEFRAGAGIVADSNPRQEYFETLHKVEALAQTLGTSLLDPS